MAWQLRSVLVAASSNILDMTLVGVYFHHIILDARQSMRETEREWLTSFSHACASSSVSIDFICVYVLSMSVFCCVVYTTELNKNCIKIGLHAINSSDCKH